MQMDRRMFCWKSAAAICSLNIDIAFGQASNPTLSPEAQLFGAKSYKGSEGKILPYRIFIPANYTAQESYPLVVWLHGAGGRGTDNLKQITGGNTLGATIWARAENQKKNPCIIVAPQCDSEASWAVADGVSFDVSFSPTLPAPKLTLSALEKAADSLRPSEYTLLALELIESLQKAFSIDANRIYIVGQSLGGIGTWALITAYPEKFAAAVPISGGGSVPNAARLKNLAIWAFHGEKDTVIPAVFSRRMIDAIIKAGGQPRYTELTGAGHPIWEQVFSEPDLLPWVFAQRRKAN